MTDDDSWQRPFAHLNLQQNPFGELTRETRGELAVIEVEPIVDHLNRDAVVQLVGPRGCGKSTALHALDTRFDATAYRRVPRDGEVETWPETSILLADEVQFLNRGTRLDLWRRDTPLAVATHTDYTDEIETAGKIAETLELGDRRSIDDLETIFHRRIEAHRREEGEIPTIARPAVRRLRERYGANCRAMENHLYEVFQTLEEPRTVEPTDLEAVDPPTPTVDSSS